MSLNSAHLYNACVHSCDISAACLCLSRPHQLRPSTVPSGGRRVQPGWGGRERAVSSCGKDHCPPRVDRWPWERVDWQQITSLLKNESSMWVVTHCPLFPSRNDIAILKLAEPVYDNGYTSFAKLPYAHQTLPHGFTCYITGWGRMDCETKYYIRPSV